MRSSCKNPGGFTLAELLFSMAIGSIVLLLAASMLGTSGESYERVGANVASEREARALITQLSLDFSTSYFHRATLIQNDSSPWPKDQVGFLCLKPAAAQTEAKNIGDLCAVYYYIKDEMIAGKSVRCLMRGFRESSETFNALRDDKVADLFSPSTLDEPIAFGVISFSVLPEARDANGQSIPWVMNDFTGPSAFAIRLVLARRDLSAKLKTTADWDNSPKLIGSPTEADRNPSLEIYETSIRFGNNGKL